MEELMKHNALLSAVLLAALVVLPSARAMEKTGKYPSGATLRSAIRAGDLSAVEKLLRGGANINERSIHDGASPLEIAARHGNAAIVQLLLATGADESQMPCTAAATPLEKRVAHASSARLAEINDNRTPLHHAVASRSEDAPMVVQRLINAGVNVNTQESRCGYTPLHIVAQSSSGLASTMIRQLVMAGANLETRDKDGHTPLARTISFGTEAAARTLVEHGANIFARNQDGSGQPLIDRIFNPERAHRLRCANRFHAMRQARRLYAANLHSTLAEERCPLPANVLELVVSFYAGTELAEALCLQEDVKFTKRQLPETSDRHAKRRRRPTTQGMDEQTIDREWAHHLELDYHAERELRALLRQSQVEGLALEERHARNKLLTEEGQSALRIERQKDMLYATQRYGVKILPRV